MKNYEDYVVDSIDKEGIIIHTEIETLSREIEEKMGAGYHPPH